jgi:hypothetical protein
MPNMGTGGSLSFQIISGHRPILSVEVNGAQDQEGDFGEMSEGRSE